MNWYQTLSSLKAMAPHSSTPAWKENLMDGGAWKAAVHGVAEGRTWLSDFTFTFHFRALEKEMAPDSNVLAWRIPGTGKPGGLPSMGSHRVGHDWSDSAAAGCLLAYSTYWLLWVMLLWTASMYRFVYKFLCGHVFISPGGILRCGVPGSHNSAYLTEEAPVC